MEETEEDGMRRLICLVNTKMSALNLEGLSAPYLPRSLTPLRETHLGKFVRRVSLSRCDSAQLRRDLQPTAYLLDNLDQQAHQHMPAHMLHPYMHTIARGSRLPGCVSVGLKKQMDDSINEAAQWLIEVQLTQDLLAQAQLYFQVAVPDVYTSFIKNVEQFRENESALHKTITRIKMALSAGFKKTADVITSPMFTGIVLGSLAWTLLIIWKSVIPLAVRVDHKSIVPVALTGLAPPMLTHFAGLIDRSIVEPMLQWEYSFPALVSSVKKFNNTLQQNLRQCANASTRAEFRRQMTNLEKIILCLKDSMELATEFDQSKVEELRQRTEAYYQQYIEIKQDGWLLVVPSNEQPPELQFQCLQAEPYEAASQGPCITACKDLNCLPTGTQVSQVGDA